MAISQAVPQNLNIRPSIIPPSAGDLEEARIRRQLDLAKLRELTLAPGMEQQRINLSAQTAKADQNYRSGALAESSAHNVAEEKHWAETLGLDKERLAE